MKRATMEITKDIYTKAIANNNRIPDENHVDVFGVGLVYGNGIYGNYVREESGRYFVDYSYGSTCD